MVILWIMGAWFAWFVVGCVVLSYVDDEHQSLFNWVKECPIPFAGYQLAVSFWPVILWFWLRRSNTKP